MFITAQGCRLRNDLYCVEWDVKLYYNIPYRMVGTQSRDAGGVLVVSSSPLWGGGVHVRTSVKARDV